MGCERVVRGVVSPRFWRGGFGSVAPLHCEGGRRLLNLVERSVQTCDLVLFGVGDDDWAEMATSTTGATTRGPG